jgi:transcriptional regulator with XRE-family HTH domain
MIGSKLKKFRDAKGYSQEVMAEHCKIDQCTYSRIEFGKIKPDLSKLKIIALVLEIEFGVLIGD